MGCCDKRGTRERDVTSTTTTHQRTVVDDERLTARPRRSLSEKTSDTACAGTNCALSSSRCTHAGHAASFLAVPVRPVRANLYALVLLLPLQQNFYEV